MTLEHIQDAETVEKGWFNEARKRLKETLVNGRVINVTNENYGAKGDGTTDDTAAIRSARDAMSTGDALYFPPTQDYYKVTDRIDFTKSLAEGIGLLGTPIHQAADYQAGDDWKTHIKYEGTADDSKAVFRFTNPQDLIIQGLTINANYSAGYAVQWRLDPNDSTANGNHNTLTDCALAFSTRDNLLIGPEGSPNGSRTMSQHNIIHNNFWGADRSHIHTNEAEVDLLRVIRNHFHSDVAATSTDHDLPNAVWYERAGFGHYYAHNLFQGANTDPTSDASGGNNVGVSILNMASSGVDGVTMVGDHVDDQAIFFDNQGGTTPCAFINVEHPNGAGVSIGGGGKSSMNLTGSNRKYTIIGGEYNQDIRVNSNVAARDIHGQGITWGSGAGLFDDLRDVRILNWGAEDGKPRAAYTVSSDSQLNPTQHAKHHEVTLEANITSFDGFDEDEGVEHVIEIVQDSTGGHTVSWTTTSFEFPGGTAPTVTSTADAKDVYGFVVDDNANLMNTYQSQNLS